MSKTTINDFEHLIGSFKLPIERPILSEANTLKRIEYCKEHLYDKYTNVIFSDESKFELCRTTKKVSVIKGEETPDKPKPNPNYSVMIWGSICRKGTVALKFLSETLD